MKESTVPWNVQGKIKSQNQYKACEQNLKFGKKTCKANDNIIFLGLPTYLFYTIALVLYAFEMT